MRGVLAGWDGLDPALRWLLRINLIALTTATLLPGRGCSSPPARFGP